VSELSCPACGVDLDMTVLFSHADDRRAFHRLAAVCIPRPIVTEVVKYLDLFRPPVHRLSLSKKTKLLLQLLPDLERQAITHRGRDWSAPWTAWVAAIEQMLAARDAGRLELPMKSHAYLYAILTGMADKAEAVFEAQDNAVRFAAARAMPTADTVQVRGQAMRIGDALQQVHGDRDPALVKLDAATRNAAPMPADVRAKLAALRGGAPKPVNTDTPNTTDESAA